MPDGAVTEIRAHDEVLLLAVLKRTLDDASTRQLVDDVETAAVERPKVPIVIDLAAVRFAPSVALGSLVQLSKGFKMTGRRLALVGVDRRVMDAVRVTQLDRILEIYDNVGQLKKA